jgi:hypothetical protein
MKIYKLLFLYCAAISFQKTTASQTTLITPIPTPPKTTSSKITLTLPPIYIKNGSKSNATLKSFAISYTYSTKETIYSKQTITSTTLPANSTTSIASSMHIDESAEKTPEFKSIKSINIDGEVLMVNKQKLGLFVNKPININKDNNNKWCIVTTSE